jgi:sugar lactone lactonase YvrE
MTQASIKLYDSNKFLGKVLDDPTTYGFTNNSCSDADGCIWVGGFHIESAMHNIVAKDMGKVLSTYLYAG